MMLRICTICLVAVAMPIMIFAETIGVFYDTGVEQIEFAADDVRTALESKKLTVELQDTHYMLNFLIQSFKRG